MQTGIIIVDHGSRRGESNLMLEELAALFGARFRGTYSIVEPAHMELAEPSIASAYAKCVERGAARVVVLPFFLGPGKHWTGDIPRLAAAAAIGYPKTRFHVAMPLGIDDLILDLLAKRAMFCDNNHYDCDSCRGTLRSGDPVMVTQPTAIALGAVAAICGTCPFKDQAIPTV